MPTRVEKYATNLDAIFLLSIHCRAESSLVLWRHTPPPFLHFVYNLDQKKTGMPFTAPFQVSSAEEERASSSVPEFRARVPEKKLLVSKDLRVQVDREIGAVALIIYRLWERRKVLVLVSLFFARKKSTIHHAKIKH